MAVKSRVARALSGVAVVAVLATVSMAPTASATSGYGLDGTDPSTKAGGHCANDSYAFGGRNLYAKNGQRVAYFEVRYSPKCGTNWVRMYDYTTVGASLKSVQRKGSKPFWETELDSASGWSYSMQVYAPGSTCIYVGGSIIGEPGSGLGVIADTGEIKVC